MSEDKTETEGRKKRWALHSPRLLLCVLALFSLLSSLLSSPSLSPPPPPPPKFYTSTPISLECTLFLYS